MHMLSLLIGTVGIMLLGMPDFGGHFVIAVLIGDLDLAGVILTMVGGILIGTIPLIIIILMLGICIRRPESAVLQLVVRFPVVRVRVFQRVVHV